MKMFLRPAHLACFALVLALGPKVCAQDATLDQLLKKLPPPEKLVKNSGQQTLEADPALKDRLGNDILRAAAYHDYNRAVSLSQKLVERYPKSAASHCLFGEVLMSEHNFRSAEAQLKQAIALRHDLAIAYFYLGSAQAKQRRLGDAISTIQALVKLQPNDAFPLACLSEVEENAGHKEEALQAAKHATTLSPAYVSGWLQLAIAEKAEGHTGECLQALNRAANLSPDNAYLFEIIGFSYINLDRLHDAIPPLERAVAFRPRDILPQAQLGFCLMETGQVDAGVAHLHRALQMAPGYSPAWEHLGLAYQKKGEHGEALKAFKRATELQPGYKHAWEHLAEEYRLAGKSAAAADATAHARSIGAGHVDFIPKRR